MAQTIERMNSPEAKKQQAPTGPAAETVDERVGVLVHRGSHRRPRARVRRVRWPEGHARTPADRCLAR